MPIEEQAPPAPADDGDDEATVELVEEAPLIERLQTFLGRIGLPLSAGAAAGLQAVIDEDVRTMEQHQGDVTVNDIAALCATYPQLETWPQKILMVQLTDRHDLPSMREMWLDLLWIPKIVPKADSHRTVAKALARLDGDASKWQVYWSDVLLTRREARKRAARH